MAVRLLAPRGSDGSDFVPIDKAPKGAFFCFVPPASPRQPFPNPCRRAAHQNYSLFSIHLSRPGLPLPLPGSAREPPSLSTPGKVSRTHFPGAPENRSQQGGGGSVPRQQCGTAKRPFPPHSPACRAQAHSEPVPQSGTPKLFTFHSSLFTLPALLLFPSGTDSKTKIYFVFWPLDT